MHMRHISLLVTTLTLWGCGSANDQTDNYTEYKPGKQTNKVLHSGDWSVLVQDKSLAIRQLKASAAKVNFKVTDVAGSDINKISNGKTSNDELSVGFPIAALDQKFSFGAVITAVSDNSELGGILKLSDLTSIPIRLQAERTPDEDAFLSLYGCLNECTEDGDGNRILSIPILGTDETEDFMVLDLSVLGEGLNLYQILNGRQNPLKVTPKSAKVSRLDFSGGTLVFDVETTFEKETQDSDQNDAEADEVTITSRWYLLQREANEAEAFTQRPLREEVGFFDTVRGKEKLLTRFATQSESGSKIKYYIKNVPGEYRPAFAAALDGWNAEFKELLGEELLDYEFLDKSDARHPKIIAGDVRYNVIEWDLKNIAPYGGLGPAIASELTGQVYAANTLVQGPRIAELYRSWFKVESQARILAANGRDAGALKLRQSAQERFTKVSASSIDKQPNRLHIEIAGLSFDIKSQRPELASAQPRLDFYNVPQDLSYEEYMFGYFKALVTHEVGHNLGLRHNFKGNLGASTNGERGKVSRSVMEYLGKTERHLSSISIYDKMAIAYGYAGKIPEQNGWFCTDENVVSKDNPTLSAECSRGDQGPDGYGFFRDQLRRAVELIVGVGSSPSGWSYANMKREVEAAVEGMSAYHSSAEATSATWTNFFTFDDRPKDIAGIQALVTKDLKETLCGKYVAKLLDEKTFDTLGATEAKLLDLRQKSAELMAGFGLNAAETLNCVE